MSSKHKTMFHKAFANLGRYSNLVNPWSHGIWKGWVRHGVSR